jgi:hypothetical protein
MVQRAIAPAAFVGHNPRTWTLFTFSSTLPTPSPSGRASCSRRWASRRSRSAPAPSWFGSLDKPYERHVSLTETRNILARYLVLALEFQLAADVLETAILPEWSKIGQLAAIAAIRTALNYFLSKELSEEKRELASPAS